jgi:hypothetical protein
MTWTIHGTREECLETTPSSEVCYEKSEMNALKQEDTNIPERKLVCRHRVEMARPIRTFAHNCSGNLDLFSFFLSFLFSPTEHGKVQEESYLIFGIDKTDAYIRTIIGRRRIASCSHG